MITLQEIINVGGSFSPETPVVVWDDREQKDVAVTSVTVENGKVVLMTI